MHATDVAVIGAGQAGLAISRCLADRGIDHVVFERHEVGARWQSHVWDSLRLLTPNWLNTLPGWPYQGNDPDGFMPCNEFLSRLRAYGTAFGAPVLTKTEVLSVVRERGALQLCTSAGGWRARALVIASGHCDLPLIPAEAGSVEALNLHSSQYRSPAELPSGGVLVVGASASGVQIADELRRAGRNVTLAVGRHTRMPRNWRGYDIFWWLDRAGILAERTRDLPDREAAMRQPSLQLAGRPDHTNVDLATLQALGVRLTGRVKATEGDSIAFADDLASSVATAQTKLERLLDRIDAFSGLDRDSRDDPAAPVDLSHPAPLGLSLIRENISTLVWATGYRRIFPWLEVPAVLGPDGEIAHRDGITAMPGVYALGFRLLRKRDSSFVGGVGSDAVAVAEHISAFLGQGSRRAA